MKFTFALVADVILGVHIMAKLTAGDRQSLPEKDFALPGHGKGPKGAGSGSYPIPNASHARDALARSSGKAAHSQVEAAVHRKFPGIKIAAHARGGLVGARERKLGGQKFGSQTQVPQNTPKFRPGGRRGI